MASKVLFGYLAIVLLWALAVIIVLQHGFMFRVQISVTGDDLSSDPREVPKMHFRRFTILNHQPESLNKQAKGHPHQDQRNSHSAIEKGAWHSPTPNPWLAAVHSVQSLVYTPPLQRQLERRNMTSVTDKAQIQNSSQLLASVDPLANYTSMPTAKDLLKHKFLPQMPGFSNSTINSSYLLALSFGEQLSAASGSMFQLAPLAVDWNAQLVEPVVLRSQMFGIDGLFPAGFQNAGQASIKLSELYDLSKLNHILHSRVSPRVSMVLFKEFIASAPRRVTVLYFNKFHGNDFSLNKWETELVTNAFRRGNHNLINCSPLESVLNLENEIENHLNGAFDGNLSSSFKVEKTLCLDPTVTYRSHLLLQHITTPGTIIFALWQGCGAKAGNCSIDYRQNSKVIANPDMFRYTVFTKATLGQFSLRHIHTLHNPDLPRIAEEYLKTVGIKRPFLSAHIRTERLLKDGADMDNSFYYRCCLDHLKMLIDRLTKRDNLQQTMLITDTGSKYGTAGCGEDRFRCSERDMQEVTSTLKSLHFPTTSYDPKLLNGTKNSAYVSLVEMNMLSMGEKLVMVGRGGFQAILMDKFLSLNHTEEEVYRICNSTKPNKDVCHIDRNS